MRPPGVVVIDPAGDRLASIVKAEKQRPAEQLIADASGLANKAAGRIAGRQPGARGPSLSVPVSRASSTRSSVCEGVRREPSS